MKGNLINFLKNRINSNKFCLLSAIEMIDDNFYAEDIPYNEYDKINFKILDVLSQEKDNYDLKDYRLQIEIYINKDIYIIKDWFRYKYSTKEFEYAEDGYLSLD